ncbi:PDZ domain-containing protein [Nocardioides mangrovicus]|uniref:PDZ domain-containing protein n=1 Tax=Nocardioides mangrovicus TaxID=2478913 RepID=A0A3L8P0M9_9ACTN|nr:trypsin-like peptidase domain-containing protein [Nocardioides mangrovicus]RLV47938.1 PDZ domain-containing protein [Nocardioides mangrovicus]
MTNEWHPFSEGDDARNQGSPDLSQDDTAPQAALGSSSGHPSATPPPAATDHGEGTRVLPPQPVASHDAPVQRHRTGARALPAAVLVGALVVGGAAGVGGAAAFYAVKGGSDSTTSSDGTITASSGKDTPASATTSSTAIESVAQKVLPSVVQINVTGSSESGTGSGIVLNKNGTILTNNHVVSVAGKSGSITVNFQDGDSAKASIVGTDPVTDLAVIKAEGVDDATAADIGDSDDLKVGQEVVAIGSPFGLGSTVTSGIVSALDRAVSVSTSEDEGGDGGGVDPFGEEDPFGLGGGQGQGQQQGQQQQGSSSDQSTTYPAIQTDAAINPGNSGGPLVNLSGQVVGINSSIRTSDSSSSSEGGSIGLGFSIPMSEVLPIVNQLVKGETPTHARLGVTVSDDSSSSSSGSSTQSSTSTGALVKSIESGGSASKAGLKTGDVITKVDDKVVDGADDLVATIRGHRPGDKVTLTVKRGSSTKTLTADLGSDAGSSNS